MNLVRTLVIPANPKTTAQQTIRGLFTSAVADYHTAALTDADVIGWRRYALLAKKVMTYFNAYVRDYIDTYVAEEVWQSCRNYIQVDNDPDNFEVTVETAADKDGKLYWGTSPGYMPNEVTCTWAAGPPTKYTCVGSGLPSETQIYFYIKHTTAAFRGRTGILMKKTLA